jgi:hypothetical protein
MKNIKKCGYCLFVALAVLAGVHRAAAQGTTFTYQGSLNTNGVPANGFFDFEFALYTNATEAGTQVGTTLTPTNIGVTNGLFTVALNFGDVFSGDPTWLAIAVTTNGGTNYTALNPLQELTPTPYAIYAPNAGAAASANAVAATNITGAIALGQLPSAVVTTGETNVAFVSLTLSSNLNLPSPATIDSGGSSLLLSDFNNNFYFGPGAGTPTNSGTANTGIGSQSLQSNTNGTNNTAVGYLSLGGNTDGSYNAAFGERALALNTSGNDNTADGRHALVSNVDGNDNTASGYLALSANTNGGQNTAVGASALSGNPSGSNNIALGYKAGNTFGLGESSNIDIGNLGVGGDNNIIRIGSGQTNTFIAGVINGNGGGLTNLSAAQLTSGTIPLAQLPAAVVSNGEGAVTFSNVTVSGNLTLPASTDSTGIIYAGVNTWIHGDANNDFYAGPGAGSLTNLGGGNTGIGYNALKINTNGENNTATGYRALANNTSGSANTANGEQALYLNTSGSANTAVGRHALESNTNGSDNVANGYLALEVNANGKDNVAVGYEALGLTTNDSELVAIGFQALQNDNAANSIYPYTLSGFGENTAIGFRSLQSDTFGFGNTALGYLALATNTEGAGNTAIGDHALASSPIPFEDTAVGYYALAHETNQYSGFNTAIGAFALYDNLTGFGDVAMGVGALMDNTNGIWDVALGVGALQYSKNVSAEVAIGNQALQNDQADFTGSPSGNGENTAIGYDALFYDKTGWGNIAVGYAALYTNNGTSDTAIGDSALLLNQDGTNNTAVGYEAGIDLTNGDNNIYIGNPGLESESGAIRIGTTGVQNNNTLIAGIYGVSLPSAGVPVFIDSSGHLGTAGESAYSSFTPTIGDGNNHNFTTLTADGYYTKTGNLVYFEIWLQWTAIPSSAVPGDSLQISLPVPVVSQRPAFSLGFTSGISFGNQLVAWAIKGNSYILLDNISGAGPSAVPVDEASSSGEIQITGTYRWQ